MAGKGFGTGQDHFKVKALAEAKSKVISLVEQGATTHQAMTAVNKKPDTLRQWILRDSDFAEALAEAKERGESTSLASIGKDKSELQFSEFSKIFLGQEVFPHHQDWVDLLEAREPSWLHPSMIYEPAERHRLLVNVPPEHAKSTVITVNYSTYRIALDPNIRIIVVSKTLVKAREFVYAIKQRLSHPRWLKMQNA